MADSTYKAPDTAQQPAETPAQATHAPAAAGKQAEEPSGYTGKNPSTAGPGPTAVHSSTPENKDGHLDPSAPGNTGITPGTDGGK